MSQLTIDIVTPTRKIAEREIQQVERRIDAWRAEVAHEEVTSMSVWFKGLGAAFLGGLVAAVAQAVSGGGFSFSVEWVTHAAVGIFAGALTAVVAYLKESPLPK